MRMEMVWVESRWQLVNAEVDDDQRRNFLFKSLQKLLHCFKVFDIST